MITRSYANVAGDQQEVTLTQDAWEALTEEELQDILGFRKPVEQAPKPQAAPMVRRKKSGGK